MKAIIKLLEDEKKKFLEEIASDIIKAVDKYKNHQPKWKVNQIEKKKRFLKKINKCIEILTPEL